MIVARIDREGYFLEDVILQEGEEMPVDCIEGRPNTTERGFYRPRWTGTEWVEDMSREKIDELNNQPRPHSEIELLRIDQAKANAEMIELMMSMFGGGF